MKTNNKNLKKKLIDKRGHLCESCKNSEWLNVPIPLELHHINPPSELEEDLQLVCPNCHSLTPNYRGSNKKKGAKRINDERYKEAIEKFDSISKVLSYLGLEPKGGNYKVCKERIIKFGYQDKFFKQVEILPIELPLCLNCDSEIPLGNKFCSNLCSNQYNTRNIIRKKKIEWPGTQEVLDMVKELGYSGTGRKLGVSDNVVRKFIFYNS
jgi:hypothetical protein